MPKGNMPACQCTKVITRCATTTDRRHLRPKPCFRADPATSRDRSEFNLRAEAVKKTRTSWEGGKRKIEAHTISGSERAPADSLQARWKNSDLADQFKGFRSYSGGALKATIVWDLDFPLAP